MGWDPVKKAKKAVESEARKAVDTILKPAADKGRREVYEGSKWARNKVHEVQNEAENSVRRTGQEVRESIKKDIPGILEDAVTEQLPKLLDEAITEKLPELLVDDLPRLASQVLEDNVDELKQFAGELQKAIGRPGLQLTKTLIEKSHQEFERISQEDPELAKDLDSIGFNIRLGLVKAVYDQGYTRMAIVSETLDRYIKEPPEFNRKSVRDFLTVLGPSSLQFLGSAKANVFVFGSSIMEIAVDINKVPFRLGIRAVDGILAAAGVPE